MKNQNRLFCLFALAPLLGAPAAHANTWNTGTGNWTVAGNWSAPAAVPTGATPALINNGGTAQVTAPGAAASALNVGSGGPGTLSISGSGALTVSFQSWIGENDVGIVNVSGAAAQLLSFGEGHLGTAAPGQGILNIDTGGTASFPNWAYLGEGASTQGIINLTGPGSTLNAAGMIIGNQGHGELEISAGGVVNVGAATAFHLASNPTGYGLVQLTGAGSTLNSGNDLIVGVFGQAGLVVNNGAVVEAPGRNITLAANAGATAELIVGAMNSAPGLLHVSYIAGGAGTATVAFAHSAIGYDLSPPIHGTARVLQTGTGSTHFLVANNYSGGTLISNGTLASGHADALGVGPVENNARFSLEANLNLPGTYLQGAAGTLDTAFIGGGCLPAAMNVTQAVTLAGALSLRVPGCMPTAGQSYTLITSAAAVVGTFAGLPDSATFVSGGQQFRIHYNATQVWVTALGAPGADAASIPTLSEWGMILLALLLAASVPIAMCRAQGPHR